MDDNCVFCRMVAGQIPVEKMEESENAFLIRDLKPQAAVHVLAIPKFHVADVAGAPWLPGGKWVLTGDDAIVMGIQWAAKNLPGGYRIVTNTGEDAGQVVKHLHFHILGGEKLKGI